MKNMKKTLILLSILMLSASLLVSCNKKEETAAVEAKPEEPSYTPVQVQTVSTDSITDYRKFGGTVTAKDSAAVLPSMAGELKNVSVKVGDKVVKDQVLATVDASRDGQKYNPSRIKAPISGTVTSVSGVEGTMTAPSSVFAMIQTLDDLQISFSVIERYVTKVNVGNKVIVTFDAIPGETFMATISEANPTIDTMTRTRSVKAKLDQPEPRLLAGMYARLSVITETKDNVIVVPYNALSVNDEVTTCYIVKDGQAHEITVTTGIREDDKIEVTSGLSAGDQLVTKGRDLLSEGALVKVID